MNFQIVRRVQTHRIYYEIGFGLVTLPVSSGSSLGSSDVWKLRRLHNHAAQRQSRHITRVRAASGLFLYFLMQAVVVIEDKTNIRQI